METRASTMIEAAVPRSGGGAIAHQGTSNLLVSIDDVYTVEGSADGQGNVTISVTYTLENEVFYGAGETADVEVEAQAGGNVPVPVGTHSIPAGGSVTEEAQVEGVPPGNISLTLSAAGTHTAETTSTVSVQSSSGSGDSGNGNDDSNDETEEAGVPWYAVAIAVAGLGAAGYYFAT